MLRLVRRAGIRPRSRRAQQYQQSQQRACSWRPRSVGRLCSHGALADEAHGPAHNFGRAEVYTRWPSGNVALSGYGLLPAAYDFIGVVKDRTSYVKADDVLSGNKANPVGSTSYAAICRFRSPYPTCRWKSWQAALIGWERNAQPGRGCIYGQPLPTNAAPQPTLDEVIAQAKDYELVGRGSTAASATLSCGNESRAGDEVGNVFG